MLLRLFDNFDGKGFVAHENSKDDYRPPNFFSGENPPVQFMGLQINSEGTAGKNPWIQVSPSSYALKLGLFQVAGPVTLAFQDTWTDDATNYIKTGTLVYDTALVTTAIGAEPNGVNCILEAEVILTGLGPYKQQIPVILKKGYITTALVGAPLPEVTASQSWVLQACVPRDGTNQSTDSKSACQEIYLLTTPSKLPVRLTVSDNYVLLTDPV